MWTTYEDVESRWLLDDDLPDAGRVEQLIADAEDAVLERVPNIQERLDRDLVPVERVKRVVASLVIEVLKNPRGFRQVSTTTGPYTDSETYGGDSPGAMVLTDAQVRSLAGGRLTGRPFTAPMWGGVGAPSIRNG